MLTIDDFINCLNGILFEIYDAEDKLVYSDFLDDQYLENYLEYKIANVSMVDDHLVIRLLDYVETPQTRCAVGQKWWVTLPPAVGEEIGGLTACEIVETEFDLFKGLIKVVPIRKCEQLGFTARIPNYEITISKDRLTEEVVED